MTILIIRPTLEQSEEMSKSRRNYRIRQMFSGDDCHEVALDDIATNSPAMPYLVSCDESSPMPPIWKFRASMGLRLTTSDKIRAMLLLLKEKASRHNSQQQEQE